MIHPNDLTTFITNAFADAQVTVTDRTGTMDHYKVAVVSEAFEGVNLLNRQRMVYKALSEPMADGRIHALELSISTPSENG